MSSNFSISKENVTQWRMRTEICKDMLGNLNRNVTIRTVIGDLGIGLLRNKDMIVLTGPSNKENNRIAALVRELGGKLILGQSNGLFGRVSHFKYL